MSKGYVNKETRILADNVNAPHIYDEGGVTDTVSKHIVDIIDDHKEEIKPIIGGGGVSYSIEEQDIGLSWIDGKKVYQRTFIINNGLGIPVSNSTWTRLTGASRLNIDKVLSLHAMNEEGNYAPLMLDVNNPASDDFYAQTPRNGTSALQTIAYITIKYTKESEE